MSYLTYRDALLTRFKSYREQYFAKQDELFHDAYAHVFRKQYANFNLFNPQQGIHIPVKRRHRWFHSMFSSQALTVSVFSTLMQRQDLHLLNDVQDDEGDSLLRFVLDGTPVFDYAVKMLNEPTPTRVDFFLPGKNGNIAIECKLAEREFGACSQVRTGRCNGNYAEQPGRKRGERCYLTEIGVDYWKHIPKLFSWKKEDEYAPCPIWKPYQLVRNVLAAAISSSKQVWGQPIAVLLYDARNPVFTGGGEADELFKGVQRALDGLVALKRTTWQAIASVLLKHGGYDDLLTWLDEKYGIHTVS